MPGKRYEVLLTEGAEQDLESIYDYIAEFDSPTNADYVLDRILEVTERLTTCVQTLPGHLPGDRTEGLHLPHRGWPARHAVPACAPIARCIILANPSTALLRRRQYVRDGKLGARKRQGC